jgi:hypothetical protein
MCSNKKKHAIESKVKTMSDDNDVVMTPVEDIKFESTNINNYVANTNPSVSSKFALDSFALRHFSDAQIQYNLSQYGCVINRIGVSRLGSNGKLEYDFIVDPNQVSAGGYQVTHLFIIVIPPIESRHDTEYLVQQLKIKTKSFTGEYENLSVCINKNGLLNINGEAKYFTANTMRRLMEKLNWNLQINLPRQLISS